ncbi:ferredoxin [Micromonospora sp. WMMD961]|uniref:ferredoxin n=1 Tax=Micromonospora sp. WMMD961 TaxID=3016100 RepID=UPI002417DF56|nr:ferredoxin [Micromonospora sp. WMMD961]MDG4782326.1 ferredoxin [Micromonospora sp. WMMD961]
MTRQLVVDDTRCIGAGQCVRFAPHAFDQDQETGTVLLVSATTEMDTGVADAVALCPSGAIRWADDVT